jgi:hypothetical protein
MFLCQHIGFAFSANSRHCVQVNHTMFVLVYLLLFSLLIYTDIMYTMSTFGAYSVGHLQSWLSPVSQQQCWQDLRSCVLVIRSPSTCWSVSPHVSVCIPVPIPMDCGYQDTQKTANLSIGGQAIYDHEG